MGVKPFLNRTNLSVASDTSTRVSVDLWRTRLGVIEPIVAGQPMLKRSAAIPHMALGQSSVRRR